MHIIADIVGFLCAVLLIITSLHLNRVENAVEAKRVINKGVVYNLVVDSAATDSLHQWRK